MDLFRFASLAADFCVSRKPAYCRLPNPCTEPPYLGGSNSTQRTLNKKYTTGVYFSFNWLCSVCNMRTELLEIGREIKELKTKLN
jgi:hypothetical protein